VYKDQKAIEKSKRWRDGVARVLMFPHCWIFQNLCFHTKNICERHIVLLNGLEETAHLIMFKTYLELLKW